jgi:CDP-glucose 4,6-dehydratase
VLSAGGDDAVLIARSCNVYGPGDLNFSRLIPRTIMRMLKGRAPVVNPGNERVYREYIFIEDLVDACLFLARHIENAGRYTLRISSSKPR